MKVCRQERDRLAVEHEAIVRRVARTLLRHVPRRWDEEELYGFGMVALIQALEKYQPGRSKQIKPYLMCRVRYGILDALREIDHRREGPRPSFEDVDDIEYRLADARAPDRDREVLKREALEAVRMLPARLRSVMLLYYREGKVMSEIGDLLGVHQSRISHLHKRAIGKLREMLEAAG